MCWHWHSARKEYIASCRGCRGGMKETVDNQGVTRKEKRRWKNIQQNLSAPASKELLEKISVLRALVMLSWWFSLMTKAGIANRHLLYTEILTHIQPRNPNIPIWLTHWTNSNAWAQVWADLLDLDTNPGAVSVCFNKYCEVVSLCFSWFSQRQLMTCTWPSIYDFCTRDSISVGKNGSDKGWGWKAF